MSPAPPPSVDGEGVGPRPPEICPSEARSAVPLDRVVTTFTGAQGSPWKNILCFTHATSASPQDAADAVAAFWGACDALMDSSVSWLVEPTVVQFDQTNGAPLAFHTVSGGSGVGAVSDLSLPYSNQALVRLFTDDVINNHQVRGRIFIPGITRNNLGEGVLNSAAITAFTTAIDALIADADSELSIWARPVTAEQATPRRPERDGDQCVVTAAAVWNQFAVLTSRRD